MLGKNGGAGKSLDSVSRPQQAILWQYHFKCQSKEFMLENLFCTHSLDISTYWLVNGF